MSAVDDFTGVLAVAPDGTPTTTPILVDRAGLFVEFTCATCGQTVSFVNATAR